MLRIHNILEAKLSGGDEVLFLNVWANYTVGWHDSNDMIINHNNCAKSKAFWMTKIACNLMMYNSYLMHIFCIEPCYVIMHDKNKKKIKNWWDWIDWVMRECL